MRLIEAETGFHISYTFAVISFSWAFFQFSMFCRSVVSAPIFFRLCIQFALYIYDGTHTFISKRIFFKANRISASFILLRSLVRFCGFMVFYLTESMIDIFSSSCKNSAF